MFAEGDDKSNMMKGPIKKERNLKIRPDKKYHEEDAQEIIQQGPHIKVERIINKNLCTMGTGTKFYFKYQAGRKKELKRLDDMFYEDLRAMKRVDSQKSQVTKLIESELKTLKKKEKRNKKKEKRIKAKQNKKLPDGLLIEESSESESESVQIVEIPKYDIMVSGKNIKKSSLSWQAAKKLDLKKYIDQETKIQDKI